MSERDGADEEIIAMKAKALRLFRVARKVESDARVLSLAAKIMEVSRDAIPHTLQ